jgi:hypothetical protein
MSIYPMDPVDAAWYHMDGRANLAMVTMQRPLFTFSRWEAAPECKQQLGRS